MRNKTIEDWLNSEGVTWQYLESVEIKAINKELSLRNQARFGQPLNESIVTKYTLMLEELEPPALVGYSSPRGFVLIDGNHRYAALERAGHAHTDLYLVNASDRYIIARLTRAANVILNGVGLSHDEVLEHCKYLVREFNKSLTETAREFKISVEELSRALRIDETRNRLLSMSIDPTRLGGKEKLLTVGTIQNDIVLAKVANLATTAALPESLVKDLVKAVREGRTEADQLRIVEEWQKEAHIEERIAQSRRGLVRPRETEKTRLIRLLASLRRLLEQCDSAEKLQLTAPSDISKVRSLIADVQKALYRIIAQTAKVADQSAAGSIK